MSFPLWQGVLCRGAVCTTFWLLQLIMALALKTVDTMFIFSVRDFVKLWLWWRESNPWPLEVCALPLYYICCQSKHRVKTFIWVNQRCFKLQMETTMYVEKMCSGRIEPYRGFILCCLSGDGWAPLATYGAETILCVPFLCHWTNPRFKLIPGALSCTPI